MSLESLSNVLRVCASGHSRILFTAVLLILVEFADVHNHLRKCADKRIKNKYIHKVEMVYRYA